MSRLLKNVGKSIGRGIVNSLFMDAPKDTLHCCMCGQKIRHSGFGAPLCSDPDCLNAHLIGSEALSKESQ